MLYRNLLCMSRTQKLQRFDGFVSYIFQYGLAERANVRNIAAPCAWSAKSVFNKMDELFCATSTSMSMRIFARLKRRFGSCSKRFLHLDLMASIAKNTNLRFDYYQPTYITALCSVA